MLEEGLSMRTRRLSKKLLRYLLPFLAAWIGHIQPAEVRAQVVGATVSGTIVDTSGGAIPGDSPEENLRDVFMVRAQVRVKRWGKSPPRRQ